MRSATGTYRLDTALAAYFGARNLRLIHRGSGALGKLGRHCTVRGTFEGRVFRAVWREPERFGWIVLRFAETFDSFEGSYGSGSQQSEAVGSCSGRLSGSVERRAG